MHGGWGQSSRGRGFPKQARRGKGRGPGKHRTWWVRHLFHCDRCIPLATEPLVADGVGSGGWRRRSRQGLRVERTVIGCFCLPSPLCGLRASLSSPLGPWSRRDAKLRLFCSLCWGSLTSLHTSLQETFVLGCSTLLGDAARLLPPFLCSGCITVREVFTVKVWRVPCAGFFFPVLGHLSICNLIISFFALMYKNLCIKHVFGGICVGLGGVQVFEPYSWLHLFFTLSINTE